jgi:Coenzyme PQQ synthesis protein D (PqqD)
MSRWERDDRTLTRSAPGVVVVLGPGDGDPICLRGTGVALWEALGRPQSTEDLSARLASAFDAGRAEVRADVEPVIAQLAAAGVLRAVQ